MSKKPSYTFKHIYYYGSLGKRKFNGYSQYLGAVDTPIDVELHSQTGDSYQLAELGKLDDLIERFRKYDIDDYPLNVSLAEKAIDTFLNHIPKVNTLSFDCAFKRLDLSKSIGLGAKQQQIYSRQDKLMIEYLHNYIDLSSKQNVHCIVNGSQKDEVRVVGKTPRFFTSFPPEHTLAATMVLGNFFDYFVSNSFAQTGLPSAVGDPFQSGAMAYYKMRLEELPYWYCTDTSAQDSSVSADFLELVYSRIQDKINFDSEEELNLFKNVKFNSINKLININGELYVCPRGLGSGDYLTIIINIIWRYYMILENYNHSLDDILVDNRIIINGDDLVMTSRFNDLNLSSNHAKIEWAGGPIDPKLADFCSMKFYPYIHHDKAKVLAVYKLRRKRANSFSPYMEAQRISGLMRCLVDYDLYSYFLRILEHMYQKSEITYEQFCNCFVSYQEIYEQYNEFYELHSGCLNPLRGPFKK